MENVYNTNIFKTFDEFKQDNNLPKTEFWRYLQLRHALQGIYGSSLHPPKPADKLDKILQVLGKGHEAAKYYKMLMEGEGEIGIAALRLSWERDLGVTYDKQEWAKVCGNSRTMSRDLRVRLIQFKILHRFYWTPSRLFRLGLKDSASSWKCCVGGGTMIHVMWSCPKINQYWMKIHGYIVRVLKRHFVLCPKLYILGDCKVLSAFPQPLKSWTQKLLS